MIININVNVNVNMNGVSRLYLGLNCCWGITCVYCIHTFIVLSMHFHGTLTMSWIGCGVMFGPPNDWRHLGFGFVCQIQFKLNVHSNWKHSNWIYKILNTSFQWSNQTKWRWTQLIIQIEHFKFNFWNFHIQFKLIFMLI